MCVRHCSQKCQKEQWKDHKILCQSICEFSEPGNQSASGLGDACDPAFFSSHITAKLRGKIARVVGNKCIVKWSLDQEEFEVLWDTGAQVSLISQEMLDERLPYLEVKNISNLFDPSDNLDLLAASGTSIPYKGWTAIDLNIDSHNEISPLQIRVPFLITTEDLDYPIIGFNVIQELADKDCENNEMLSNCLKSSLPPETKSEGITALINSVRNVDSADVCFVKTVKRDITISKGSVVNVPCRANTGMLDSYVQFVFEPDEEETWPSGLSVSETLLKIKGGSSNQIKLEVRNDSSHDIVLKNRTLVGRLELVHSITSVEVKCKPFSNDIRTSDTETSGNESSITRAPDDTPTASASQGNELDVSEIDLEGLTPEKKSQTIQMLNEETDSFSQSEEDIGVIKDLELDIKLKDGIPVQKNYLPFRILSTQR